ncbi:hypothetical protein C0J52_18057 [Blattella germanica]|nr:hypothetical protein C0J52_18057 [Blattella germanica]
MAKDKSSGNKKKSKKSEASQESKFSKDRRELSWQEKIIESPLNDDNFKCNVTMFVEANVEYNEYLTEFANGIEVGSRKCISAVTMKDIQELSASKDRKHPKEKESPKSDKSSSKKGNRTPKKTPNDEKQSPLLAVKNKFVEKKEIEIQLANDIERETKNICDQGEPGKKGKDKKEPKTAKAKKKGEKGDGDKKVATIETADKKRTQLRKRGEEWRDITYVEDSPVEGPDLYIALIGFYDPRLPLELRKAGVPLQGLVKVLYTVLAP